MTGLPGKAAFRIAASFPLICLLAATARGMDLTKYRKAVSQLVQPKLANPDFNAGTENWDIPENFRHDPNGGRSGTGALMLDRDDPQKYTLATQTIALQPGTRYVFGAWIRTQNVRGDDSGATICLEFANEEGWIGGHYASGIKGDRDWTWIEGGTVVPLNAVRCTLTLYMRQNMTGKAWFDDVRIRAEGGTWSAAQLHPSHGRVDPKRGELVLGSYIGGRFTGEPGQIRERNLICLVEAQRNGKTIKERKARVAGERVKVRLGPLAEGDLDLKLTLLDKERKLILGKYTLPVSVSAAPPESACRLDEAGRILVNGKPFLPVGLYCSSLKREDIARLGKSPFNCVIPYNSMSLKLDDSSLEGIEAIRETLDACNTANLKVIFSIKDVFAGTHWERTEFFGTEGEEAVIEKVVGGFKDHPALLAWYINDELPVSILSRLISRRREVNRLDPDHPTWAVLYQFDELRDYAPTCDILGVDPYPIENEKSRDMRRVLKGMEQSRDAVATAEGMALWVVPQIFNWGSYRATDRETFLERYRDPSESEMRAMALLCALMGAKGFIFYSYFDLFRDNTLPDFERRWPEICRVGQELRDLSPYLLSTKPHPKVQVDTESGQVLAECFLGRDGKRCALIAGIGPGESKALIRVAGTRQLKSKYGLSKPLGGGRYLFTGQDICADILVEE